MKSLFRILAALLFLVISSSNINSLSMVNKCDIANFYEGVEVSTGTKVLTRYGELKEAEIVLLPISFEPGLYDVDLTYKGSDIYKIEATDYYIETRFCFQIIIHHNVIVNVESKYGYSKGTIYF